MGFMTATGLVCLGLTYKEDLGVGLLYEYATDLLQNLFPPRKLNYGGEHESEVFET